MSTCTCNDNSCQQESSDAPEAQDNAFQAEASQESSSGAVAATRDSDSEYTAISLNSCEVCDRPQKNSTPQEVSQETEAQASMPAQTCSSESDRVVEDIAECSEPSVANSEQCDEATVAYAPTMAQPVTVIKPPMRPTRVMQVDEDLPQRQYRPMRASEPQPAAAPRPVQKAPTGPKKWLSARILISLSLAASMAVAGAAFWATRDGATHKAKPVAAAIQGNGLGAGKSKDPAKGRTSVETPAKSKNGRAKTQARVAKGDSTGSTRLAVLKTHTKKHASMAKAHEKTRNAKSLSAKNAKSQMKKGHAHLPSKKQVARANTPQRT